jgi:hypothetical protein
VYVHHLKQKDTFSIGTLAFAHTALPRRGTGAGAFLLRSNACECPVKPLFRANPSP